MSLKSRTLEGYRVLTLRYPLDDDLREYIYNYRVLASHIYWCKKLGIDPDPEVVSKLTKTIKSYWRDNLLDERDPLYLFRNIARTPRPYRAIVNIPLVDAIHEKKGAHIKDGKLVLRLDRTREYPIPEGAWRWLEKRLKESPDSKFVRVFERDGMLVVQIVLRKVNTVNAPKDPLLVVVDVNSDYGIVVHFWDGRIIKTIKLKPPNLSSKRIYAKKLMALRDRLYNIGCIDEKQINTYSALIRRALSYSYKGWVQQNIARIVKKIRRIARRHGKQPLVAIDVPEHTTLQGTRLQKTLLSFTRGLENLLSWYGIYWIEERLYSSICPKCENKLTVYKKTKKTRIIMCNKCDFKVDRDEIPLYWALKLINTHLALKG